MQFIPCRLQSRNLRASAIRLAATAEALERRTMLTAVVVNTTADVTDAAGSAVVSLRDAVNAANKSTSATTITFSPPVFAAAKTISLMAGDLELSGKQPVIISGPAAGVTVSGNGGLDFLIDKGATTTISALTITGGGGYAEVGVNAGGIENNGSLTLKGDTVSGNSYGTFASGAGGIDNTGTLVIMNSTVGNNAGSNGGTSGGVVGGIDNESGAVMTLTNVAVSGNTGSLWGGIENSGTATLTGVTVSGSSTTGIPFPEGGAPGDAGGIGNYGKMTLTNCTVSNNANTGGTGGGIANFGALTLADSTISDNTGAGLYIDHSSSSTVIGNSIIAGNFVYSGSPDVSGAVQSSGYNLIGVTNGSSGWKSTDRTGTAAHPLNALLSPLAPLGGLTMTQVPLTGSPAIDHGSNALVPPGTTADSRGLPRIVNHTVDIGAVEVQTTLSHIVVTVPGATGTEGMPASISLGSFTDLTGAGPFVAEVNWGDGSPAAVFDTLTPGVLPRASHTFVEEGTYKGAVTVIDTTGHSATAALSVKVADAPLSGSAAAKTGLAAGVPFAWQVASFNDANPGGAAADFTAKISWGDGTTSAGVVASTTPNDANANPFGVTGTHTYAKAGTYTFTVTVTDVGGASLTKSAGITCVTPKTIVVNTANDQTDPAGSATVSLRDAVALADRATTPTAITFNPTVFATAKTINLGSELVLSSKTTISITGPAAGLTISGNKKTTAFAIEHDVSASISGLTITNGNSAGVTQGVALGGGVFNAGILFLNNCSVTNSMSAQGGGIYNFYGFLVTTGVTVSGNQGGGIENMGGKTTLINSTIANNQGAGGGVNNDGPALTLEDCTITGNNSNSGVLAGGINNNSGDPTVIISNTIVAGNAGSDAFGPFGSLGHNLIGIIDGPGQIDGFTGSAGWISTDLIGTMAKPLNAKLGPLANNGGPTQTMLPESGSMAIDHGSNALIPQGLTTDQRGRPRVVDGIVDIGADEVQ